MHKMFPIFLMPIMPPLLDLSVYHCNTSIIEVLEFDDGATNRLRIGRETHEFAFVNFERLVSQEGIFTIACSKHTWRDALMRMTRS